MSVVTAIGLMSGTSLDGVDVAAIETDGVKVTALGPTGYRPYADAEKAVLRKALEDAASLRDRTARPGTLAAAEAMVTAAHAQAVTQFLSDNGLEAGGVAIAGFHGQTVLHRPEQRLTVQLGDGAALARAIGIPVAFDFRAADVAAGGEGAPLVPIFHAALVETLDGGRPVAVLNIGGVANVTYCDDGQPPVACDTGPGNALLDDFLRARTGQSFDAEGATAARGTADHALVERMLGHDFFHRPPPKSLDRNAFADHAVLRDAAVEDGAATLAAFSASAVRRIVPHLPKPPVRWIVAGGGARNRTLLRLLAERLNPAAVVTADSVGWSGDALEAQAFAYLAVRAQHGLPITFPTTTGVSHPMTGGTVVHP